MGEGPFQQGNNLRFMYPKESPTSNHKKEGTQDRHTKTSPGDQIHRMLLNSFNLAW